MFRDYYRELKTLKKEIYIFFKRLKIGPSCSLMFKIISPFTKNCFGKQVHYFDGKKSTAVRNFTCNLKKGFLRYQLHVSNIDIVILKNMSEIRHMNCMA